MRGIRRPSREEAFINRILQASGVTGNLQKLTGKVVEAQRCIARMKDRSEAANHTQRLMQSVSEAMTTWKQDKAALPKVDQLADKKLQKQQAKARKAQSKQVDKRLERALDRAARLISADAKKSGLMSDQEFKQQRQQQHQSRPPAARAG